MRRFLLVLSAIAIALVAAGCAYTAPGWTFAPATPTPAATPAPSGGASAAPSSGAPATASAAPSDGSSGSGTVVQVSAAGIAFEQTDITAPAGADFVMHFDNKDAGIPHNIEIKDSMSMSVFKGDTVTGPAAIDYKVTALAAGAYTFNCTIHPNMTGKLTVGP